MFRKLLALSLSATAFFTFGMAARGSVLFYDNFNGGMSSSWSILRPDSSYYSFDPTDLDLRANSGDLWLGENNAKNVFLIRNPAPGDFIATLGVKEFQLMSQTNAPQIALLAYDTDDSYVRDDFGSHDFYWPTQVSLEFADETPGPPTYSGVITDVDFKTNPFFLRLEKIGNVYTEYYSTDGTNFIQANGSITYGSGNPFELGFAAMSDPLQTSQAFISSFEVDSVPEPASLLLLGIGIVLMMGRRGRGPKTGSGTEKSI